MTASSTTRKSVRAERKAEARTNSLKLVLLAFAVLGSFALYWRTAAPTVLPGDSGELQFAAWGFWLAHPTGYPLYLLLGGIWQHIIPFGDPAYRLNLFSAFWTALAVGVAFLAFDTSTRSRGAAVIAALTFAVSPLVWAQATRAEVYALNSFFLALLTLWAFLWVASPSPKYAAAFALTFGLALTHHRMTILFVPAFSALLIGRLVSLRATPVFLFNRAVLYSALVVIPLLLYLYIPLRTSATPYARIDLSPAPPIVVFEDSPRGWLNEILGQGFSGELGLNGATTAALRDLPNQFLTQFNPVGLAVIVTGFFTMLWQRRFSLAAFVLYGTIAIVIFSSVYHIGDIEDYYTPALFFACIAIACLIATVTQFLNRSTTAPNNILPAVAMLAFFALLTLQNLFSNFYVQDRSRHTETRAQWEKILSGDIPANAILLSNDRDEMTPLYYFQLVEHNRPDLVALFPKISSDSKYGNVVSLITQTEQSERPVYAIKPIPALKLKYSVAPSDNGLYSVNLSPLPPAQNASSAVMGNALGISGYSILDGKPTPGNTLTLGVQYQVLAPLTHDYTFSIQLFDASGNKVAQGNDHVPGVGEYPPTQWKVGDTLQDQFQMELPGSLQKGEYQLMLHGYRPTTDEELSEITEIGKLEIAE